MVSLRRRPWRFSRHSGRRTDSVHSTCAKPAMFDPRLCRRGRAPCCQHAQTSATPKRGQDEVQLTKSRLQFSPITSAKAWLLAREVYLCADKFLADMIGDAQLTHAELFFKHHEQAGAPRSHLTLRCSIHKHNQNTKPSIFFSFKTYCMFRNSRREAVCACWMRRPGLCRDLHRSWSVRPHSSRARLPASGSRASRCRLGSRFADGLHRRPWSMMRLSTCSCARKFGRESTELQPRLQVLDPYPRYRIYRQTLRLQPLIGGFVWAAGNSVQY